MFEVPFCSGKNLGLIIIDEEHETTYKQSEPDPRYHARDVALKRIELVNGILILGSATPSIESYYRTQIGEYTLIEMPERATQNSLPEVKVVDLREEFKKGNKKYLAGIGCCHYPGSGQKRAGYSFFKSPRVFHFCSLSRMRSTSQMPPLFYSTDISRSTGRIEMSLL